MTPLRQPTSLLPAALLALFLMLPGLPAAALELRAVEVRGLTDEAEIANVRAALSLVALDARQRADLGEGQLDYLLRQVPRDVARGLEPFGYYETEAESDVRRDGEAVTVLVTVRPGEPVRVDEREIRITGEAGADEAITRRLRWLRPRTGQPLRHDLYEASKATIDALLRERGYFDARQLIHRVEVDRGEGLADIFLTWESGERYRLGEAGFSGHPFREGLLEKLVDWEPGTPYTQSRVVDLQQRLAALDYFAGIDVRAEPVDGSTLVPVDVRLTPAKRSVYSAGLRYSTDRGAGITGGLERRWVNDRGHKLAAALELAQRGNEANVAYRIPAFAWLAGWYTASASLRQDPVDFIDSEVLEVAGTRSGQLGDWNLVAGLHFRRERFDDPATGNALAYSTLVYPQLSATWRVADDPLYPRRGHSLHVELRGGHTAIGSDIDFLQARAEASWVRSLDWRNRILLRAELGTTLTDDFDPFPPLLRFYAGGDQSVRGYGHRDIGEPFTGLDNRRYVIGGKHLVVASVEFERMFTREWGGAVFVDAGDAFDDFGADAFDVQVGVGVGLRWRSPVGPVRLDLAHGLGDDAQDAIRLHLTIGPDL
ncbi:autotransporter assembly complex family protein [Arenimonas sp.]|uniref:autotransporter assembly complex protein TamA n=1 Tax=Arenimonas sp. TaxID=1872635 RepID=UPI0035AFA68B